VKLTYLLIGMACIVPQASNAEESFVQATLYCDETKKIMNTLRQTFKEMPFVFGKTNDDAKSVMSLWVNPTTKSWSIIATKKDISCVVGVGDSFELVPHKNTTRVSINS
jgi:hypothetical protein